MTFEQIVAFLESSFSRAFSLNQAIKNIVSALSPLGISIIVDISGDGLVPGLSFAQHHSSSRLICVVAHKPPQSISWHLIVIAV